MKCANNKCKWHGAGGECRLFVGAAAAECKYRKAAGKAAGTATATRKGK
jgi:hypothetical protein